MTAIAKPSAMCFDYSKCEAEIKAATSTNYQVNPYVFEAFQKSSTAAVLAVRWYIGNPLSGQNAVINCDTQNKLKDILSSMSDFDTGWTRQMHLSNIEPLDEFVIESRSTATLHCFGYKYNLTVPMADSMLPVLIELIANCNNLMKSYAKTVNNSSAYALLFGYCEAVFVAMKRALTNALIEYPDIDSTQRALGADSGVRRKRSRSRGKLSR